MESNTINLEGGDDAPEGAMAAMGQNIQIDKDGSSSISSNIYKTTNDKDEKESTHFMTVFEYNDLSFLIVICICNFAQGFRRLLELGLYYVFKDKLGLQPGEITMLLGIMAFPWVAKIFLAIFADNVTCCGSRRKSYLIINSIVNILSIVALMIFGLMYGKIFIMCCIILSQICMTWCDAISDALIAQASRNDLKNGANNLNTITTYSFALGGIIACSSAGTIELDDGKDVDPNVYFGTYAGLIFFLLVTSIFLNRKLEPELILLQRER
jgi:MFS family permease